MAVLVLEESRLAGSSTIIASTASRDALACFWRHMLAAADAAVRRFEADGDEVFAAVERAERDRLRRIAPLFGGADGCLD